MQSTAQKSITIHLYGELFSLFGGPHEFFVSSPVEVMRLMQANFPKFYGYIRNREFHVLRGKTTLPAGTEFDTFEKWFRMPSSHPDLHIVPVMAGASAKGTWTVVAGAALIAAAVIAAIPSGGTSLGVVAGVGAAGGTATGLATPLAIGIGTYGTIAQMGLALAIGGITNLLAKAQNQDPGHIVGGLLNTPGNSVNQGVPVPVVYGRVQRAGSVTIATSVSLKTVVIS